MDKVARLIKHFNLKPHPEGGYFGTAARSSEFFRKEQLPDRYSTPRNLYSSIYFMVTKDSNSKFHKLKTDEIWHFYSGDNIVLHLIREQGMHEFVELSNKPGMERFQYMVPKNTWIAAKSIGEEGYALVGCTLAPGFEYEDFELADRNQLIEQHPHLEPLIIEYT